MTTEKTLITAEELWECPEISRRSELLKGKLVEMTPPGGEHSSVSGEVYLILRQFVRQHGLPFVVGTDAGVILERNPDTVRAPDAFAIARDRLPNRRIPASYLTVTPDLIVEVVSPHDRAGEVRNKVGEWLRAGARLVWVIFPEARSVTVYRNASEARILSENDTLDAEPILPGFACTVRDFFESVPDSPDEAV